MSCVLLACVFVFGFEEMIFSGFSDLVRLVQDHGLEIGGQTNAYLDPISDLEYKSRPTEDRI